ncbi:Ser/thr kinase [Pandoravirus kuranda]|uniref:Ser/thr kinase n=1 Tax=Pandoravirus kuranda TaxID=3019033 RepID=A0AA95EIY2_9VIRU|nr:Ser/thr kinase [Pandoravirus kuranda]
MMAAGLFLALVACQFPQTVAAPVCLPIADPASGSMLPATPTKALIFGGTGVGGDVVDTVASAYVFDVDDVRLRRSVSGTAELALQDYASGRSDVALLAAQVPRALPGLVQLPVAAYGIDIVYTMTGGSSMAIFDGLALFGRVWSGAIARWDDPALTASSGATPDMLPTGPIRLVVERFAEGSLDAEAASLGAVFGHALANASADFAAIYDQHGRNLGATVLAVAGANRTLLVDPVAWAAAGPSAVAGVTTDPATGALLFESSTAALAAAGDGAMAYVLAGDPATAAYPRPLLISRTGRVFFGFSTDSVYAALDAHDPMALRTVPYDTGLVDLSNLDSPDAWPIVGILTAVLRTDGAPSGYDCQYGEVALSLLAWMQINDGALAATLASGTLAPLSGGFRQRATNAMGTVALCPRGTNNTNAGNDPAAAAHVAATALVGAGTTSLVWSAWMQAYTSRTTRLKLAEATEEQAIMRLANYGVDFAATSSGVSDLTPVLAAACADCVSLPVAVRPYAPVYNVPEVARAADALVLDAHLLAGIFLGRIDMWNHSELAAANPSLAPLLPARPIVVVLAKGGMVSGAGGPLGGVANRFAAEYMAADADFRTQVLNGSATTVGQASLIYPIESAAPTRVVKAGLAVAAAIKAQTYSIGVDAVEAALAARNLRVANLLDAQGTPVTPSADALAATASDFVWGDLLPRIPARRGGAYAAQEHAVRARQANNPTVDSAFGGLPVMMVGAATAGAWPIAGWHHAYMHGATTPECAKASGLVDALYWTQTSDSGAAVAAAQGLAATTRAVGPNALPRILVALANVTCTTNDGVRQSALSVAPCIYVPPGAIDATMAATLCATHGDCVIAAASSSSSSSSSSSTTTSIASASTATCACQPGWKGTWCETVDDSNANPAGSNNGNAIDTALIAGVVVAAAVALCCGAAIIAALAIGIALVRHRGARRRALDSGCEIDLDEIVMGHSLGAGATSEVFDGVWHGTRVAVKRFRSPVRGWDRAALAAFGEEVRVMCALRHPNVVMFMGASTRPPVLAIVMEHMALGSLRDVLNNELLVQIPFKLKVAIAHQTAKGMHFLHSSGISHGDLKSLNILITEKWQAKVSDFGLSSTRSGSGHQQTTSAAAKGLVGSDNQQHQRQHNLGTVHWAAPERILWASGGDEADVQAADVYSFGVVLWELLTRDRPYLGCSPAAVQVAVMRDGMRPDAHAARAALAAEGVDTFDAARYDPEDDISAAIESEAMPRAIVASYVGLYRTCWDTEPAARPTFLGVLAELGELAGRVHDARPYGASDSSSSSNTQQQSQRVRTHDHAGGRSDASRTGETITGASGSEATTATDDSLDHSNGGGGVRLGVPMPSGRRRAGRAPDGMVVVALADVAHAATLWESVPEAMSAATLTFTETMRRLTTRYGGHESAQAGRATASMFCAVFADPCAAIAWAAAAQRLLASDETVWPADLLACPEAAAEYPVTASTADIESGRAHPIYRGLRVRMALHHGHVRRVSCDPGRRPEYEGVGLNEALRLTALVRGGHVLVTESMCRHLLERPRVVVERCLGSAGRLERAAGGVAFGDSRARRRARFAAGAADIMAGAASAVDDSSPQEGDRRARMSRPVSALSLTTAAGATTASADAAEDETARRGALAWHNLEWLLQTCDKARARLGRSARNNGKDIADDQDGTADDNDGCGDDDDEPDSMTDGDHSEDEPAVDDDGNESHGAVRTLLCQLRVAHLDGRWADHALLAAGSPHQGDDGDEDGDSDDDGYGNGSRGHRAGPYGGGRAWGDGRRAELAYVDSANLCRAVIDPKGLKMGRVIGSGSFATVYRATWNGVEVAVKRLARARLTERDTNQFRAEVVLHTRLEHPNVLPVFGACFQEGNLCLVTEYVQRGTLRDLLASPEGARLGWDVRLRMLRHVARGVAYLHARSPPVVHRDLKPANLLVGDDHRIKVADFGLARVKEEGATMTASRGTRAYAAPEVLLGRPYTEKVDVYAMGLIMWSVLTRREPFADRGPHDAEVYADIIGGTRPPVPSDTPADFLALMSRCWKNNPARRPTMQMAVEALTAMIGDGDDIEIGLA